MLNAAPDEFLDFSTVVNKKTGRQITQLVHTPFMQRLSNKQCKTVTAKMTELRKAFQKKVSERKHQYTSRVKYDSTFAEGVKWLDSLTGEKLPEKETTIKIDTSVWKSEARKGI